MYDVAGRKAVYDEELPGRVIAAEVVSPEEAFLWRSEADGMSALVHVATSSSMSTDVGQIDDPTTPSVMGGSQLATEHDGVVRLTDLASNVTMPVLAVETGVRQWTALGFSGDGRKLVVTNESSETIQVLDATSDQWTAESCLTAGREFSVVEWTALTGSTSVPPRTC